MTDEHRTALIITLALILGACGSSTAPVVKPPVAPTSIVITSASAPTIWTPGNPYPTQSVSIHLHNNGGVGDFYLEFWGLANSPLGSPRVVQSAPVAVLAGYDEALVYQVTPVTVTVKVKSRPINTAVYTQTDCANFTTTTNFCP